MYEATHQALWDNKVGREGMELGKSLFLLEIKNAFSWVISTELYPKVLQKNEQWRSLRADIIFAIFIIYLQYLALRLELKQHFKKKRERERRKGEREGRKGEREEERKGRRERGKSHKMCLSDLLLPRALSAADRGSCWVPSGHQDHAPHHCLQPKSKHGQGTKATVPVECGIPLMWTLAPELPTDLAETLLELQCHVRFYISKFSSSFLHRCQTCAMV